MMKRIIIGSLVAILVLMVALVAAKDMLVKQAVIAGVKAVTGLELKIDTVRIGLKDSLVGITGLQLFNPAGFEDRLMIDLPEVFVQYNLPALLRKEVHLQELRLHLKEFTVVKNAAGEFNIDALTPVQPAQEDKPAPRPAEQPAALPPLAIDLLELKIGTVYFKDYSAGPTPSVKKFAVNINERFEHITDPKALVNLIVMKALAKTSLASLVDINIAGLKDSLGGMIQDSGGIAADAGKELQQSGTEAVKQTTDSLKNLLPRSGAKE